MSNESLIKELFKLYHLGDIKLIEKINSSQNNVYKVITNSVNYTVKIYSKDAIGNYNELKMRKEQLKYASYLYNQGVNVLLPLKIHDKFIFKFKHHYFLLYETFENDNVSNIKNLVELFSSIHYPKLKLDVNCHYNKVNLVIPEIQELIDKSNYYVDKVDNLVISHNDFKPLNILWKNEKPYLIDFDAVSYSNVCASLIEFALNFSTNKGTINYNKMSQIFMLYFKDNPKDDFDRSFYLSITGKLLWLNYLISINNEYYPSMIKDLKKIMDSKDKIKDIYESA